MFLFREWLPWIYAAPMQDLGYWRLSRQDGWWKKLEEPLVKGFFFFISPSSFFKDISKLHSGNNNFDKFNKNLHEDIHLLCQ